MTLLAAREVSVELGGRRVVDGVSTSVAGGEMLGLIGPNGAGKTTLLRALRALQPRVAGEVHWHGRGIEACSDRHLARDIAYLAQGAPAHWPLTVQRVVELGRLPHLGRWRRPAARDRAAVQRALADAGVGDLASRTVTHLSGGERVRVLFARMLASEPTLILADEPVAALDPLHQLRVMSLLRAHCDGGRAAVVVLHDLTLAARYCDRLLLLHEGRRVAEGPPAEVITADNLARTYGVQAHLGRLDGRLYVVPRAAAENVSCG